MKNPSLLRFLSAVEEHGQTSKTLMESAGFDALELELAAAIALEEGYKSTTGQVHPSLRLTAAGWACASEQLAPFARLFAVSVQADEAA